MCAITGMNLIIGAMRIAEFSCGTWVSSGLLAGSGGSLIVVGFVEAAEGIAVKWVVQSVFEVGCLLLTYACLVENAWTYKSRSAIQYICVFGSAFTFLTFAMLNWRSGEWTKSGFLRQLDLSAK